MGTHARHLVLGALIALPLALATACPRNDEWIPPRPKPVDAGTPADCASACARMQELKCPEGQPDEEGTSCQVICEHVEASGTVTLDPACVTRITTCSDLDRCSY